MFMQKLGTLTNHIRLGEAIQAYTQAPLFREQWRSQRSLLGGDPHTMSWWNGLDRIIPLKGVLRGLIPHSLCSGGLEGYEYDPTFVVLVEWIGLVRIIP
jgi:hypothetical protein